MTPKVCLLDYGSGNVRSVHNLLNFLNIDTVLSNDEKEIENATHLILPGVGAFHRAMININEKLPLSCLKKEVFEKKKPFLGICVGMQVLADEGEEFGSHPGLGWIPGKVVKLEAPHLVLPHIGWNTVRFNADEPLFKGLGTNSDFYFVHSYAFKPFSPAYTVAETIYENSFCSAIHKENIWGVQFHPEKSQKAGMALLKNFVSLT